MLVAIRTETKAMSRARQCEKKKSYASQSKATKALDKNHGYNNPNFNVYECPHCATWHVGHKPKQDQH